MFLTDVHMSNIPRQYCDVHLRKMVLEQTQLLCNAHRIIDGSKGMLYKNKKLVQYDHVLYHLGEHNHEPCLYLLSHKNHPISKWVRASHLNYKFSYRLLVEMHNEYEFRFNKKHKSKSLLNDLKNVPRSMKNIKQTPFMAVVSDGVDKNFSVYEQYQQEMLIKYNEWMRQNKEIMKGALKKRFIPVEWTKRDIPEFVDDNTKENIIKYGSKNHDLYDEKEFFELT